MGTCPPLPATGGSGWGEVGTRESSHKKRLVLSRLRRSPKPLLKDTKEHEVLQCLNLVYMLLTLFLGNLMKWVVFGSMMTTLRIFEKFVGPADLLRDNEVRRGSSGFPHEGLTSSFGTEENPELPVHSSRLWVSQGIPAVGFGGKVS